MKRIPAIFSLFMVLILTMTSCNFFPKASFPGANNSNSPKMAGYTMFEPASEAELAASAARGEVNAGYIIVKVVPEFDTSLFTRMGATISGHFNFNGYSYYRLYKAGSSVKLVAELSRRKGVIYAQHELISSLPNNESSYQIEEKSVIGGKGASEIYSVFDDPKTWGRFGHFETTKALDAYKAYGVGENTVYVVDIDTGINRTHEDFKLEDGSQIIEYAKSAFNSSDGGQSFTFVGDKNGFIEVPVNENWDEEGHGTHTAGTIAALGNNGKGVAGVAWKNVKLISYKCFSNTAASGSGSDWAVYGGLADLIKWKTDNSINQTIPVNMSLGSSWAGFFELDMINQALANDIMIVASMGNSGYNAPQYPAAYNGVMAIGATRADGSKVHFSTSGNFISVSAPGYNIYSTFNEGDQSYIDMSGTSMAAPFATGTVAYLLTFNPTLKPDQLRTIIESTAMDLGTTGWDEDTGYGLINVKAAVDLIKNNDIPLPGSVYSTKTTKIYVNNTNQYYDSGIAGFKHAVVGQPVYIYNTEGNYVCLGLTNGTDGSVEFRMLKPGDYTARTNYLNSMLEQAFTVTTTEDTTFTLSVDKPIVLIQTVPNLATDPLYTSWADSIITLYDSDGNVVGGPYDHYYLDTLVAAGLESGKTYIVKIAPYSYDGSSSGEYGLNIGLVAKDSVNTTLGRGPGLDDSFEENDTFAAPAPVSFDTDYGLYLGDDDYFSFVMP